MSDVVLRDGQLNGVRLAVLIESDFFEPEIAYYQRRFAEEGAEVDFLTRLWGNDSITFQGHEYRAPFTAHKTFEGLTDEQLSQYAAVIDPSPPPRMATFFFPLIASRRYHLMVTSYSKLLLPMALVLGCSRNVPPPTPLTLEELPGVMEKAFSAAKPQAKELATQVVTSVQAQDYSKSFWAIQNLGGVPDLNKEQANVAARATLTISALVQSAEAKGDAKAAQTMKRYMETK